LKPKKRTSYKKTEKCSLNLAAAMPEISREELMKNELPV